MGLSEGVSLYSEDHPELLTEVYRVNKDIFGGVSPYRHSQCSESWLTTLKEFIKSPEKRDIFLSVVRVFPSEVQLP